MTAKRWTWRPIRPTSILKKRIWLTITVNGFNNPFCNNEEKLVEHLDQAILVSDNSDKYQQINAIVTVF